MRRIIVTALIGLLVIGIASFIYFNKPPIKGTVIRYEDFRGTEIPIKADGKGGEYKWYGDVLWEKFTIEEKFDFARIGGGLLSDKDIQEIKQRYGEK